MIDVVVVGGGPVGLMTAIQARLAGLETVVLERRPASPDKACGEGLMPDALSRLLGVGVDPPGMAFAGIRYVADGREAVARFSDGVGRGVRRTALRAALERRAHQLGAIVIESRVTSVEVAHDHVQAGEVRARYLVAADGLHSCVRDQLGLGLPPRPRGSRRYGVRRHLRTAPWSDLVEVHWTPHAELYVTPVAPDLVGVAALGPRPLSLTAALASAPELALRVGDAAADGPDLGCGPLLQRTRGRVMGRALLVGDASGYVDALTGEGLRLGFAEAQEAVAAISRDDPASYEAAWRRTTRSYRVLTRSLLAAASFPPARRRIVPAAARLPGVFDRAVQLLAS